MGKSISTAILVCDVDIGIFELVSIREKNETTERKDAQKADVAAYHTTAAMQCSIPVTAHTTHLLLSRGLLGGILAFRCTALLLKHIHCL